MVKPVAWYRGEDNANDVFGNHGVWTKTPTYTDGVVGRAFRFNNYSPNPDGRGAIDVPRAFSNDLSPTQKFSMRCWVKQLDSTSYGFMFAKGKKGTQIGGEDYAFGVDNRRVKIWTGNPFHPTITTGIVLVVGQWHDVIWTYNNMQHQVYVDGVIRALDGNGYEIQQSLEDAFIGFHKYDPAFNAHVDEIRIYHDVITPDNVDVYTHEVKYVNGLVDEWNKTPGGTPPDIPNTHQIVVQNGLVQSHSVVPGGVRPLPHINHQIDIERGQIKAVFTT